MTEENTTADIPAVNKELLKIKKKSKTLAVLVVLLAIIICILAYYVYQLRSDIATIYSNNQIIAAQRLYPKRLASPTMISNRIMPQPNTHFRHMQQKMNSIFKDPFFNSTPSTFTSPHLRFTEKPNEYLLSYLIPGMSKEDISIKIHNKMLTVTGKSNAKSNSQYSTSEFTQTLSMPQNSNVNKITSSYKNGILTVIIPKTAGSKAKSIAIK